VFVSILALFIRQAQRMRHIIMPSVACLAVPFFPHYPTNRTILDEEMNTKFVFLFPIELGLKHLSL